VHLDAFAAALASGRPCVNGYSGSEPPWENVFRADPTLENLDRALIEIKAPARSVEVVSWEALAGPARAALPPLPRVPTREWGRYHWGDLIDFSGQGTAGEFVVDGIDRQPATWRWTIGTRAHFRMTVEPSERDRVLVFDGLPLLSGPVTEQAIEVFANGRSVDRLVMTDPTARTYSVTIPAELLRGRTLDLELAIPGARTPESLGLNEDRRVLGFAFRWAMVE
jgi:hypothetical protein